ncbi:MAG TPA: hypothetical protein VLA43_05570 [Longimicrobiales bacterium]|nr:hypothetical protein [Longimicrobiales bacterium]
MMNPKRALLPVLAATALLAACAGGGGEPAPASGTLAVPGLAGQKVLVFPVQEASSPDDATRELVFALENRRGTGSWIFPEALRSTLARSPQLDVPLDDLPVGVFLRAEVRRIGDPLYGMIRRAASLNDATTALLPVGVAFRPATPDAPAVMEVLAAVVDVTTGRVVWLGRESAPASSSDDPGGVARAMDMLAGRLLPAG